MSKCQERSTTESIYARWHHWVEHERRHREDVAVPSIVQTNMSPDIALSSEKGKKLIIKLTKPWESRCEEAYERKKGKAKPVFHDDLSSDLAYDICSDRGLSAPEYVRMVNKTDNASVTYGLKNEGFEQYFGDKDIGFGIYPTNRTGVVSIHAWHGGNGGKMVSMLVDVKNGTILSTEIHTDFTKIMCYGNSVNRTMNKRSISSFIVNALRKVCSYTLDFSPMGDICENSLTATCVPIAAALELAIAIPGDSLIWFPVCKGAVKVLCAETAGAGDPNSVEVCKYIENYLRDHIGSIIG